MGWLSDRIDNARVGPLLTLVAMVAAVFAATYVFEIIAEKGAISAWGL